MDETNVPKVVRHLIDEKRLAGAVNPRIREIILAEAADLVRRHRRKARRISRLVEVGVVTLQVENRARHVGEFLRPLDPRVRGKNLFEQRRTGARHPEDEDRFAAGGAVAGSLLEELARADPLMVRRVLLQEFRAVAALGALQRVAALVEAE